MTAEQLAAGLDRGVSIEIDHHAIAEVVDDVVGEVFTAKRGGCAAQDLEQARVTTAEMEAPGARSREREHLEAEAEERNRRAGDQRAVALPQHLTCALLAPGRTAPVHL